VRRNDGFSACSIFLPALIDNLRLDSSDGFNINPLGLTSFPPNEDGDNYNRQQGLAEQERDEIVVLPKPGRCRIRNTGEP
jgi:hypothetical protein